MPRDEPRTAPRPRGPHGSPGSGPGTPGPPPRPPPPPPALTTACPPGTRPAAALGYLLLNQAYIYCLVNLTLFH